MTQPARPRLSVEFLESRDLLSGSPITESFDAAAPPSLPSGWGRWGSDGTEVFTTSTSLGVNGSTALVSSGGSRTAGLAWYGEALPGDTSVAASIKVDSLIPTFVFARGSNLGSSTPSYLAAVVTRGLKLELWEVTNGTARVLGSVSSPPTAYLSGPWVRVTLTPTESGVAVEVQRQDNGQYLTANGTWQATQTTALAATTTLTPATGRLGVGRLGLYAGPVRLDDFTVVPPEPPKPNAVSESFDTTTVGAIPTQWQTGTGGAAGSFRVNDARDLSPENGFTSTGGSTTANRAWSSTELPAAVDASAAVYLDTLVPARVFVRGTNLNTTTPTYYAAQITRGLTVQLVRVVNGTETVLGSLKSSAYVSSEWVRVRIIAEGERLRVSVYRTDTRQWLSPDGSWGDTPDFALERTDSSVTGVGFAGLARRASYAGALTFDDFSAVEAGSVPGPTVAIQPLSSNTVSGDVRFTATATGELSRVEFRLNGVLRSVSAFSPASWTLDTTTLPNGNYTLLVRAFDTAGNLGTAELVFTVANIGLPPIPQPDIPRHYSHIRIAALAYSGNPMGTFEQNLLRNSVDLVVPNPRYLSTIQSVAPDTPQMIYSNVTNIYEGLLTDWLAYADRNGADREAAFYHVTHPTPFSGASASSQPVNWFWAVYQTPATGGAPADVTAAARGARPTNVTFGGSGTTTAMGYTERFRELNVTLVRGAASGWSGVWEYATAVDSSGNPTAWRALNLIQDGTNGMRQTGRITFDPAADWVTSTIGGSARFYYVRFRVTAGTAAQSPELKTIFGRDYVNANGAAAGIIPAFDYTADTNHDGYLTDSEYAGRQAGMDARFVYESRLFYPYYGQQRFVTNPADPSVRRWAGDYHLRLLQANPLADGVFMDNSIGRIPFSGVSVLEPTANYSADSGALIAAVSRAIAPNWVLANTAGGGSDATPITAGSSAVFEEFLLRPLDTNWAEMGDVVNLIRSRLEVSNSPYLVIDSHPAGGSPTDPRTQLATLAYYYLVGDPNRTFLMFYGGYNPASSWTEHWTPAAAVNVGQPTGQLSLFATGTDPANPALTYQVFARNYTNALVLYKPLSYTLGSGEGTTGNNTATTHQLNGRYRQVNADGTLGPVITSITLRNGEGAVLIRA